MEGLHIVCQIRFDGLNFLLSLFLKSGELGVQLWLDDFQLLFEDLNSLGMFRQSAADKPDSLVEWDLWFSHERRAG